MASAATLKRAILARLDITKFYEDTFDGWRAHDNVSCPFADARHDDGTDESPSMSVDESTGAVYCHSCGYKASSPIGLYEDLHDTSFIDSMRDIYSGYIEPIVPEKAVVKPHRTLLNSEYILQELFERRGITKRTVRRYKLGWSADRLWIPICNEFDFTVNVRRYDLMRRSTKGMKVISWKKGFGKARVWPHEQLSGSTVVVCEGELDALLAIQKGLPAVTVTGGARSWNDEWNDLFKNKHVVLVPDNDPAGFEGAELRAAALSPTAKSVTVIKLPVTKKGEDLTDWFMKYRGSVRRFDKLVKESKSTKRARLKKKKKRSDDALPEAEPENFLGDAFNFNMSSTETIQVERAERVFEYLSSHGAFFRDSQHELYYAVPGSAVMKMETRLSAFMAYLSRLSPLINAATSSGKFIINYIMHHAYGQSTVTRTGAWSLYVDSCKIYFTAIKGRIGRVDMNGVTFMKNAINSDRILLEAPSDKAIIPYSRCSIRKGIEQMWSLLAANIPTKDEYRYMVVSWLVGIFFREYVRPKPLLRFLAKTSYGKSTSSKMISLLIYGEEMLNHSASTLAASYGMSRIYPLLIYDNIETRNMTPAFEDFMLVAATGAARAKRKLSTDTGLVIEHTNCLIVTNGIEPFNKHELIARTIEVPLDLAEHGHPHFHEPKIFGAITEARGHILSSVLRMIQKYVFPRVADGEVSRISKEFGTHSMERFNDYFGLMSIILDAMWRYVPHDAYSTPNKLVSYWLNDQDTSSRAQKDSTNEILYFLDTFADRRNILLDAQIKLTRDDATNIVSFKATARALLSDFRILARHLGIRCPWNNERQLGLRIVDAEDTLAEAGWTRYLKISSGRKMFEYRFTPKKKGRHGRAN